MSILIKGIEMPKNCYECFCHEQVKAGVDHPAFDYCVLENWKQSCTPFTMTVAEAKEGIADSCPLVEVPTPHGRLIDAGAIFEQWYQLNFDRKISDGTLAYWNVLLGKAPTVIEAEEDNNGR